MIYNETYKVHLSELNKEILEFKKWKKILKDKIDYLEDCVSCYNNIEIPSMWLKEIKSKLNKLDTFTVWIIIEWLKIDSYTLVQNIAKTINKANASEVIAFRDWALARNDSLISILNKNKNKNDYKDKITWEIKNKKNL